MRIVIDMQGAQTESRFRGIGRYTLTFTQAIVRNRCEHEVILALNGLFPETIQPIRDAFEGLLPQENIRVWDTPWPVCEKNPENDSRRKVAELLREAFLASLEPDIIHVHSFFEGYGDDAVLSIGQLDQSTPISVTVHDLIPLLNAEQYLTPNPRFAQYYYNKIEQIKRGALFLSISESSKQEAIELLGVNAARFWNTSEAVDSEFRPIYISDVDARKLYAKFGLTRPFVLYSGGADIRKNLHRLIQAFAALPGKVRTEHQLLFTGRIPEGIVLELKDVALRAGLGSSELRFSGYVSDTELVQLYNLCRLYVFPSWHEGFGLPPLEAMACGAAVIGSNTSSLPEVIGLADALFDPMYVKSISAKIVRALSDEGFRARLCAHGAKQVKKFSWDRSANRAIAAWEALVPQHRACEQKPVSGIEDSSVLQAIARELTSPSKLTLSKIASCLAQNQHISLKRQLLLDISELHNNDAATGVQRVVRSYLHALLQSPPTGFQVEPVYATLEKGYRYARQFKHQFMGHPAGFASPAGEQEDAPMRWQRGDVFFALDMQHHVQLRHADFYRQIRADGVVVKFLVHDLLPIQLADFFENDDAKTLHESWLSMIAGTDGAVCVSKSTAKAFTQWISESGTFQSPGFQMSWVHNGGDIEGSKPSRGMPEGSSRVLEAIKGRSTFLSVSTIEPRKCQWQILGAVQLLWDEGRDVNLVLVGKQGWKVNELADTLRKHSENGKRLFWLEGISDEYLDKIYQASTALIAASLNEGFGLSLIEAARHQVSIIAREIPVFQEIAGNSAYYFRGNSAPELATALKVWLDGYATGQHPKTNALKWYTWTQSAEKLKASLIGVHYPNKQLFVDISELVQRDAKSGIQRVVRSVLKEWLGNPPDGYRVEPVYATVDDGYRYARRFAFTFTGEGFLALEDELIEYAPGDVFFGLDMQPQVTIAHREFYQILRRLGISVKFLLHDLLPIQIPEHFPPGNEEGFTQWLNVITESDGVVCVSRTVARELAEWVAEKDIPRTRPLQIEWSHNGADIDNSAPTTGLPKNAAQTLEELHARPSFLMVGTVEPRKAHTYVLDAFEQLWEAGKHINLIIVGKKGWKVEALIERIKSHPEFNQHLFWLADISDEYLKKVYKVSRCLIAASEGEGFGLPLIEAAQNELPIIARDIPIFREVAGNHAFYFAGTKPEALSSAISDWMAIEKLGKHPKSDSMPFLSWRQSAARLQKIVLGEVPNEAVERNKASSIESSSFFKPLPIGTDSFRTHESGWDYKVSKSIAFHQEFAANYSLRAAPARLAKIK